MHARRCLSCPRRRALWGHSAAAAVAGASAAAVAAANGTAPAQLHRILLGCPIPAHPSLSPLVPANSRSLPLGRLVVWSFGRLCWSPLSGHIRLAFLRPSFVVVWADPLPGHPCLAFVWPLIAFVRANPHYSVTHVWPSFGIRSRSFAFVCTRSFV
jgi:hypothetical protein